LTWGIPADYHARKFEKRSFSQDGEKSLFVVEAQALWLNLMPV
jgi:hypothetical protein